MSDLKTMSKENILTKNPVLVQLLGICSTLAVTNLMKNTLIMTAGVIFVTAFSSLSVSLLKDFIPRKVRMLAQTLIIAFYTVIVDLILKAYVPDVSKELGPYVGLIITNCIIMGRAEAFAQMNPPIASFLDGVLSGIGYMAVLIIIAIFRELLGFGTLLGVPIFPETFSNSGSNWTIMVAPASAFFFMGIMLWIANLTIIEKEGK